MACTNTNVVNDTQPDANGTGDSPKNVTDILTTEQTETLEQVLSDSNGVVEEVNNAEVKPYALKTSGKANNEKNAAESSQEAVNGAMPKKARRVCFHDDKLVSGYMIHRILGIMVGPG